RMWKLSWMSPILLRVGLKGLTIYRPIGVCAAKYSQLRAQLRGRWVSERLSAPFSLSLVN
ncbi:hypothetical protein O6468_24050, partial [Salmonella enterica subsp. enterica]